MKYEKAVVKVTLFSNEDVIQTSPGDPCSGYLATKIPGYDCIWPSTWDPGVEEGPGEM